MSTKLLASANIVTVGKVISFHDIDQHHIDAYNFAPSHRNAIACVKSSSLIFLTNWTTGSLLPPLVLVELLHLGTHLRTLLK